MTANVGGRDGAFFSLNTGAEGYCQGLQQATKVTFLMLVNIIKHSEKKKNLFSLLGVLSDLSRITCTYSCLLHTRGEYPFEVKFDVIFQECLCFNNLS